MGRAMSIEDDPEKPREDDRSTPEWQRAWAKQLRENGFTKMAEQHAEIARALERRRKQRQAK